MTVPVGVMEGKLTPCIQVSNCFHSENVSEVLVKQDLLLVGPLGKIKEKALEMGLLLKKEEETYLYFIAESKLFGFVDDIEFFYDVEGKKLHFKSSSRVGKSDLGVNEKRIRAILSKL